MSLSDWFIGSATIIFALSAMILSYELSKLKEKYHKTSGDLAVALLVLRTTADINAMRAEDDRKRWRRYETTRALRRGLDLRRDALWNYEE